MLESSCVGLLVNCPLLCGDTRMDRIKTRQEKFKKGKEKILSMTQESGDGQNLIPPEEEEDDDGMTRDLVQ